MEQVEAQHKNGLPAAIAHWNLGAERIIYREVEPDLRDAKAFVEGYALNMQKQGWKSITEQLARAPGALIDGSRKAADTDGLLISPRM